MRRMKEICPTTEKYKGENKMKNITMESFQYLIKEKIEEKLGDQCKVVPQNVTKNNGIRLQGLMISSKESNVSPTIYMNHFYERYQGDEMTLDDTVSEILHIYHHHKLNHHIKMESFLEFSQARKKIFFKLINTEANWELLKDVPHRDFLDLSIVYVYEVKGERLGNASITIRNSHLDAWKISEEELHEAAEKNTPQMHPYHIESLHKVMQEICMEQWKEQAQSNVEESEDEADMMNLIMNMQDDCGMYVLSNKTRMFGAACMLYDNIIKDFSTACGKNLMILPSSIHEILMLPVEDSSDADHFKQCVMDVNRTQLEAEDILSDSVYYYNLEIDELTKIK